MRARRQGARQPSTSALADAEPLLLPDLRIRTKDRRIIAFEPNEVQRAYLEMILPTWQERPTGLKGAREILLKARQEGFSTLILALFFLETITVPNTQTVVIAHDADSTERLFQTVQRFWRHLPEGRKPRTKYANRREFLWPDLDSYFFVGTAGSGEFGRGGTINNAHLSEVAFWPAADDQVAGLLQAVPADGNVFIETTAKGLGNWFYTEYQAAQAAQSVFTPRFFAWWEFEGYRLEGAEALVRTEEEAKLAAAYSLDDAQLRWRREKLKELKDKFPQEYPANPGEAFLASGNPYFDRTRLRELLDRLQGGAYPPVAAEVPTAYPRLRQEVRTGALTVWEPPQAGRLYVIGADTAEGLTDAGEADYDCADVFDAETWTQVAHLHGRWDTHEYGLMLAELGLWYNMALLGIERNNHGHAVINAALHAGYYPPANKTARGLYYHEEFDETKRLQAMRPGWPTTPKTKYFALDGLATSLENGDLKFRSPHTLREMLTYVKLPGGRAGGEGKSHDDAVISAAIADALLKIRPRAPRHWSFA